MRAYLSTNVMNLVSHVSSSTAARGNEGSAVGALGHNSSQVVGNDSGQDVKLAGSVVAEEYGGVPGARDAGAGSPTRADMKDLAADFFLVEVLLASRHFALSALRGGQDLHGGTAAVRRRRRQWC